MKKELIAVIGGIAAVMTACVHQPLNTSASRAPVAAPQATANELGQPLPQEYGVPADKIRIVKVDVFAGGEFRVDDKDCAAGTLSPRIAEAKRSSPSLVLVDVRQHAGAALTDVRAVMDASVAAGVSNLSLASVD